MNEWTQSRRRPEVLHRSGGQAHLFPASESTHKNYKAQWNRFVEWAELNNIPHALPLDPGLVVRYLEDRYRGNLPPAWNREAAAPTTPGTIRVAVAAIAYRHRRRGMTSPCETSAVRSAMEQLALRYAADQRPASPLNRESFDRIRETATEPRIGRGGRRELKSTAERRGRFDIALIGLMRDAMLRVGEAADLRWVDIVEQEDGSGRIVLSDSETGLEGAECYLSPETMGDLAAIRRYAKGAELVLNMSRHQISSRIRRAAEQAGLDGRFNGHSPRMGMVRDMAAAGASIHEIQQSGRWQSARMPAQYARPESLERLAAARRLHDTGG